MDTIMKYIQNHDIDCISFTVLMAPVAAIICGIILLIKKLIKNMMSCHITQRRNKATNSTDGENLNSYSSNEDLTIKYLEQKNQSTKEMTLRHKSKRKRNQNATILKNTNVQPMCVNVMKENVKPRMTKQTSANSILGLRKKCIKAAALKATNNNNKLSRTFSTDITLKSNLTDSSSLSSSSTSSSISSSSASSSPAQSVNSSPTASPTTSKRYAQQVFKKSIASPLRQFTKLNMAEREIAQQLERYVIDTNLLRIYGFPVESIHYEGCVEIFKCLPKHLAEEAVTQDNQRHHCHFYGRKKYNMFNSFDQKWQASGPADSGIGSSESSPRFTDSDSSEMAEDDAAYSPLIAFYTPDGVYQIFSEYCNSREKQCVRCSKVFQVNENGEYMSFEACTYHWGKLSNVYDGKCYVNVYSCCQGVELSEGCSKHPLHVWNGVVVGINGPYTDFLHTQHKKTNTYKQPKIYALDCEMSYTGLGLEVTKVTVVSFNGSLVYEHFVRPQANIIDYNTRFSGVSEKDFSPNSNTSIKTFAEVQKDLLNLFDADTILIGHGLENDLKVLRLVHKRIVDTSVIFSHSTGYPYRRSLKNLTKSFLKRDIQCGNLGHNSFEDSQACLELMLWKIRKDLRHWNYH